MREQRQVLIVLQKDPSVDEPGPDDLHQVGTVANILRYVTAPDGAHHMICQGVQRFRITEYVPGLPYLVARGLHLPEPSGAGSDIEARFLLLREQALEVLQLLPQAPQELRMAIEGAQSPAALADLAAAYMDIAPPEKQEILETVDLVPRLDKVSRLLAHRLEVLKLSAEIGAPDQGLARRAPARGAAARADGRDPEAARRRRRQRRRNRRAGEGDRRRRHARGGAEAGQEGAAAAAAHARRLGRVRHDPHLPRLADRAAVEGPEPLPIDIAEARKILDADHFGLEKIKSRIIEYLAVRKLAPEGKAPILCFVGPPGVGKTSLGQSIARALGRPFVRTSLGGVHDEAEIRGHRRTYIGALPGNIIQAIRKAGSRGA